MKNTNISEYKSLSSIVDEKDVLSFNIINNKKQLFIKISNLLIHNTEFSSSQLSQVLLKNESDKPTNIGSGVAIPNIQDKNIKIMCGCFIRLENSVVYDSLNNDPVDLIFALLSPSESATNHLRMLAETSRLLKKIDIQNKLRGAENNEALYGILTQPDLI